MKTSAHLLFICLILFGATTLLLRHHFLAGTLLMFFRWPVIAALVLLASMALWCRHRLRGSVALLMATALFMEWGHTYRQHAQLGPVLRPSTEVRVLSQNLYFRNTEQHNIIAGLLAEDPDVVALQEVTPSFQQHLRALHERYAYSRVDAQHGTHGFALFSDYPLSHHILLRNKSGRSIAQCARLEIPGRTINLCNAHLASPAWALTSLRYGYGRYRHNTVQRVRQWHSIRRHLAGSRRAMVLGDLNTFGMEPLYRRITKDFVDTAREFKGEIIRGDLGPGPTWPISPRLPGPPIFKIDYILASGAMESIYSSRLPWLGSDHLGVRATLRI